MWPLHSGACAAAAAPPVDAAASAAAGGEGGDINGSWSETEGEDWPLWTGPSAVARLNVERAAQLLCRASIPDVDDSNPGGGGGGGGLEVNNVVAFTGWGALQVELV